MPSDVGKQAMEVEVVQHAVALELDCVAALTEAADRTDDAATHASFVRLAAECEEHVRAWQERLRALGSPPGKPNRATAWLNRIKVQVVAPFGRKAIAFAITNNPADCVTAYERVSARDDLTQPTRDLASQMLRDATQQRATIRRARESDGP